MMVGMYVSCLSSIRCYVAKDNSQFPRVKLIQNMTYGKATVYVAMRRFVYPYDGFNAIRFANSLVNRNMVFYQLWWVWSVCLEMFHCYYRLG